MEQEAKFSSRRPADSFGQYLSHASTLPTPAAAVLTSSIAAREQGVTEERNSYRPYDEAMSTSPAAKPGQEREGQKVKRARPTQTITRNRKITSCLQCRTRKQKCDRQRPLCGNCSVGNLRDGMCTYVDTVEEAQEVLATEGEKDAKRTRVVSSNEEADPLYADTSQSGPSRPIKSHSISASLAARRLNIISATAKAGRDKLIDFEMRVRCARAAAVGTVLFGTPQTSTSDGSVQLYSPPAAANTLKLPTAKEVGPLLDVYRTNVEWMCNVIIVDLNRARIENFLNWYHSNPQTLPADPPLIPLVLVILALAIQARRTVKSTSSDRLGKKVKKRETREDDAGPGGVPRSRAQTPHDEYIACCSSEKELLETAGRCIDALQIACPSNWASAFAAPLDLIRANLLRGLWHLSELHLQFAGSCFAATVRLAHAAALNRDTRYWPSMGKEEAQARRNMFWNVAMLEVLHTNRVVQPLNIVPGTYDTQFPDDHEALLNLYRRAGLIEPYIVEGRRSHIRVHPASKANFDFHMARFQLTDVLIQGSHPGHRDTDTSTLAEAYEGWKKKLPLSLAGVLDKNELGVLGGEVKRQQNELTSMDETEAQTRFLQDALLQMMSLSISIQIHRPQVDETGRWRPPEGQAQRSLELCIDSAQRLIWLIWSIISRDPGPPFVLYSFCIFYCFQAAIIISIQSALCGPSQDANDSSAFAVLARPSLDKAVRTLDLVASKEGLRLVAAQASRYSSTLREIDLAQQRSKGDNGTAARVNAIGHVPGAAIGEPPPIVVEGNGKKLGGQGYPSRHASRAASPDLLASLPGNGNSAGLANEYEGATPPFAFDFNDLQVFPAPSQEDDHFTHQQEAIGMYGDRPLHEVSEIFGTTMAPISYTRGQHSTGLDLLAAQVEQARSNTNWPPHRYEGASAASSGSWAAPQEQNGPLSFSSVPPWNKDRSGSSNHSGSASFGGGRAPNTDVAPPPPAPAPGQASAPAPSPSILTQHASAPPVESLGETFAMDWNQWEQAVNRLLHSEQY